MKHRDRLKRLDKIIGVEITDSFEFDSDVIVLPVDFIR